MMKSEARLLSEIKRERPKNISDGLWLDFNLWADSAMLETAPAEDWRPWFTAFLNGWDSAIERLRTNIERST